MALSPVKFLVKHFLALCFCDRFYRNKASVVTTHVATFLECHHAVNQGVKRVVFSHAHIRAGIVDRSALANDDVASHTLLSTENLYA